MSKYALRLIASLTLALAATSANSTLLSYQFTAQGDDIQDRGNWLGPGPLPTSVEFSFELDTLSYSSFTYTFGERKSFRFEGVEARSISLLADGVNLWTDPDNTTFTFSGSSSPYPQCFCLLSGSSTVGESLVAEVWTDFESVFDPLSDDPLGDILSNWLIFGIGGWSAHGAWGDVHLYALPILVPAVPIPAAVWLFGTALGVIGVMRRNAKV